MHAVLAGLTSRLLIALFVVTLPLLAARPARAQEHPAPAAPAHEAAQPAQDAHTAKPGAEHAAASGEPGAAGAHEESIWPQVGKIVNFLILVGTVVYFGRKPIADYLANRRSQVRADLVAAEEMKKSAATQIAEMDAKLKALPGELEALKVRGQQEIAAEERRIRELADAERTRLLEQATREIDQRVRLARRELLEHAATLTVNVAQRKISDEITDADRARLVDRYVAEVKSHE